MTQRETLENLEARTRLATALYTRRLAGIIFLIGLFLTWLAWDLAVQNAETQRRDNFRAEAQGLVNLFLQQMRASEQMLRGVVGLFCGSELVTQDEWQEYLANLRIEEFWPGIAAAAFAVSRSDATRESRYHVSNLENPIPPRSPGEEQAILYYIFPSTSLYNKAIGFNMYSSAMRKEALQRALRTGKAASTGPIQLITDVPQEEAPMGFLTILPLYKDCSISEDKAERIRNARGWVMTAFRANELLNIAIPDPPKHYQFQIFTSASRNESSFLYSTTGNHERNLAHRAEYFTDLQYKIHGKLWTFEFFTNHLAKRPWYELASSWIALAGIVFNSLLFYLIYTLSMVNVRARTLAQRITYDLQNAKANLEETVKDLERSNSELDKFVYVACHDLSAPLRGIKNLVEWTLEDHGSVLPAEAQDFLYKMRSRANSMEMLLRDLLNLSRVGRADDEVEEVDFAKLVDAQKLLLNIPSSFTIEVTSFAPAVLPRVGLSQVIRNLLQNAISHHDRNTGRIVITAEESKDQYLFSVADDGPGIASEYQDAVFEIFKRLPRSSATEGTGIGLSIVKKVVERYGGRVWFESELGKGTTFYFTLPKLL